MLCMYGAMYMLYMSDMYIWSCFHVVHMVLCTYGVVCMIVHEVLCACGAMYMLYIQCCVQAMPCTCCACGIVYMWCRLNFVHVMLCT